MEDIRKGAVVVKSTPAPDDMVLINAQSLRKLKEDEVFTFRIAACDTQVDRDHEHFSKACLEKMAELYVGKTVISDHQWTSRGQMARVYKAEVEQAGAVSRLVLSCYMLRSKESQPTIDAIEAGIVREVSVAAAVRSAVCDICGVDKSNGHCGHRPGAVYDGKVCTVTLDDPTDVYEVSFVAVPAQREAGVVKSYAGDKTAKPQEETARKRKLAARLALEKTKFIEEVPEV